MPHQKHGRVSYDEGLHSNTGRSDRSSGRRHNYEAGSSRSSRSSRQHGSLRVRQGKHWSGSRQQTSGQSSASNSTEDTDSNDIPGFYYDKEKKRYFKIMPNHSSVSGQVTSDVIKQSSMEKQRQNDLTQYLFGNYKSQKQPGERKPGHLPLRSANLCHLLFNSSVNYKCPALCRTHMHRSVVKQFLPKATVPVVDSEDVDPGGNIENIKFLLMSKDSQTVIGVWSRCEMLGYRIHHAQISPVQKAVDRDTVRPHFYNKRFLRMLTQTGVSSCCWAPTPTSDNTTCILLTGTSFIGNRNSYVRIWDYTGSKEEQFFDMDRHMLWCSAWNGDCQHFSVGTDTASLVVQLDRRQMREFHLNNSPVHAQIFSKNGQRLFSGNKVGEVHAHDLRSHSTRSVVTLRHKIGLAHLYHSADENCLVASDVSGQIKKWDLRSCRVVQRYHGNINQYVRQPFHVDQEERVLCTVGEDCYTRLWCYRTGELLTTIPPPHPALVDSIPAVAYCPSLGGPGGLPALMMATRANFHIYTL